jgi:cytidylate kinase
MQKENLLVKYFSRYIHDNEPHRTGGPIITISREYGCFAQEIAEGLSDIINNKHNGINGKPQWNIISKEILSRSAEELQTKPEKIEHIFDGREMGFFEEVVGSVIKNYYVRNSAIIKTVKNVIRSYAWEGNAIIIGRASCVIAADIEKSLHVKLVAPHEYRVGRIAAKYNLSRKEASEQLRHVDESRQAFLNFFTGTKPEMEFYDLMLNRSHFSRENIIDIIYKTVEYRGLFNL